LYLECQGRGGPTVVLETGAGDRHEGWFGVQARAAARGRVCSYDRAGLGRSDDRPGTAPPTAELLVRELRTLLRRARVRPPYVLVGHSLGGYQSLLYATLYPQEAAGAVFVDASEPAFLEGLGTTAGRREVIDYRAGTVSTLNPSLGDRPVVALFSGLGGAVAGRYAARSTSSSLVHARGSGHYIQDDRPALVAEAIRQVVTAVRNRTPLARCVQTPFPRLGGECRELPPR
jgi:pimeloyl-ACP methyl ester carboxylesterase